MQQVDVEASFFHPTSVVIVGASEEPGRIGSGLCRSVMDGVPGEGYCINPKHATLWGRPCYGAVTDLPAVPSHALIAVARKFVPGYVEQCIQAGVKHVVVVSSGFKETDALGAEMERDLAKRCREAGVQLLGPNTLGFMNTAASFNGTFLPARIAQGHVSVISQSGGVGQALLASLQDQRCGLAKWVGIGNEAVLDAVSFLRYFERDPETRAIAVCFEGLRDLPGFLRLAAEVNLRKPVVLLRDGKSAVGMKAAASHTGTMAQSGDVMGGLIAQFGLLEAKTCRECAAMLKALSLGKPTGGSRAALLTNTAGPSILAADVLEPAGITLPQPSQGLRDAMDAEAGIPMGLKNPADISSNGLQPHTYGIAARHLLGSAEYDILLAFFSLNPHLQLPDGEIRRAAGKTGKPVVACFLGSADDFFGYDRSTLEGAGIPCYYDPHDAAAAVTALVSWGKALESRWTLAAPKLTGGQKAAVTALIDELSGPEAVTLTERDARRLLQAAGAAVSVPVLAETADQAVEAAEACGYPVVLKLHSRAIPHKSDGGGVRLNLKTPEELRRAWEEMLPAMRQLDPDAGLTVQAMAPDGFEMILGALRTPATGPMVMAGMGGIYSEVLRDVTFRMLPLYGGDAEAMVESLRCAPILSGFRGKHLDQAGFVDLLERVAELAARFSQIREMDLNPCRVGQDGVAILDARIVLEPK